jgi:hypothetical protein
MIRVEIRQVLRVVLHIHKEMLWKNIFVANDEFSVKVDKSCQVEKELSVVP